ncbi:MAG: triacylglycerol lipase [Clostridia bacterium]|nr:triacylglycerol lipase [Clostridia bacterium]
MFIFTIFAEAFIVSFIANCFVFIKDFPQYLFVIVPIFLFLNLFAGIFTIKTHNKKLKICYHGSTLLCSFGISIIFSTIYQVALAFKTPSNNYITFIWSLILCLCVSFIVFWNGIICVYLTSTQLGIKIRLMGIICGMIPIANLVALFFIIKTTVSECRFEAKKEQINIQRKNKKLCATKYPILMVHGVFFRDTRFFNYWGRIPKELETNGATIFYGNHPSAASIADSAAYLKMRIEEITEKNGVDKVNIIAHSKGGLDCRCAISKLGVAKRVASLTTINTPHRGCLFADYLLTKIPSEVKNKVAKTYNSTVKKFGEANPDFLAAVNDLTVAYCNRLNSELITPQEVYCQSVGSVMAKAKGGKFPLNFSYHLVKHFSGENDGLVNEKSFKWGEKYTLLRPIKKRGISHGDIIDLNRENINGFDVREFYVSLVSNLKAKGL